MILLLRKYRRIEDYFSVEKKGFLLWVFLAVEIRLIINIRFKDK